MEKALLERKADSFLQELFQRGNEVCLSPCPGSSAVGGTKPIS